MRKKIHKNYMRTDGVEIAAMMPAVVEPVVEIAKEIPEGGIQISPAARSLVQHFHIPPSALRDVVRIATRQRFDRDGTYPIGHSHTATVRNNAIVNIVKVPPQKVKVKRARKAM